MALYRYNSAICCSNLFHWAHKSVKISHLLIIPIGATPHENDHFPYLLRVFWSLCCMKYGFIISLSKRINCGSIDLIAEQVDNFSLQTFNNVVKEEAFNNVDKRDKVRKMFRIFCWENYSALLWKSILDFLGGNLGRIQMTLLEAWLKCISLHTW